MSHERQESHEMIGDRIAPKPERTKKSSRPKGQMRERAPGVWLLCVSAGFDNAGKRRRFYRTFRGTWEEADSSLGDFKRELEDGVLANGREKTLAEYLNYWLKYDVANEVAASTLRRYRADIERFVIPTLGAIRLADLKPRDLKQAYSTWQQTRQDGRKGTLSAETVRHAHRVLRHALAVAILYGDITRNPADAVKLPKGNRREMKVLTEQQAGALINAARDTDMEVTVALGLGCGMRRNEILGLRWKDVNLDRGVLVVAQSMDYDRTTRSTTFKSPKNNKARPIALPALVIEPLRRHKARQNASRLNKGGSYKSALDLVVCAEDGSPLVPDTFTRIFRRMLKKAGLPVSGPHALRHTFASLSLGAGANPLIISQALGHHSPGFTLDRYAHALPTMQQQTATVLDATLRKACDVASQERAEEGLKNVS